jgi:hypothetical protein
MQMILYQMLTDGSMEIPHLNRFAPYLDDLIQGDPYAADPNFKPHFTGSPRRVLKSHSRYGEIPKGRGRYIYVVRDGKDVAVSYYRHHQRSGYPKSFKNFFDDFIAGRLQFGKWDSHVADWNNNSDGLDVLFVHYEAMLADLPTCLKQVAEFCGIPLRQEELPRILNNCSFEFMRAYEAKLDVKTRRIQMEEQDDHFIRRGKSGDWRTLFDATMKDAFDEQLRSRIAATPILERYDDVGYRQSHVA